jgi:hypothetical protein
MVLHYFLADDTIEIREVQQTNSGRDGPGIFLKRQKLPRAGTSSVHAPGSVTSRTLLNVFAKSGTQALLAPSLEASLMLTRRDAYRVDWTVDSGQLAPRRWELPTLHRT